jgi:hypothetical protein
MVFSGAGGDLRVSLTTKRHPVDIASLTPIVLQDPAGGPPALNMFQAYFERSDAVNYGALLLFNQPMGIPLRPVVQTYGLGDTFSTNGTMQALQGATGLPVAAPIPGCSDAMGNLVMPQPMSCMNAWPGPPRDAMGHPMAPWGTPLPAMNNITTSNGQTTALLVESDPMGAYDGHFVLFNDPVIKNRVVTFLGSATTATASVRP